MLDGTTVPRAGGGIDRSFGSASLEHIGQCLAALGKRQRYRIEAVPLPRGTRAVRKHVAKMAAAARANLLHANHSMTAVAYAFDVRFIVGFEKTRPAGARVELGIRTKQGQTAESAGVCAVFLVVQKDAAKSSFGAMLQQHSALVGIESGADLAALSLGGRSQITCRHAFVLCVHGHGGQGRFYTGSRPDTAPRWGGRSPALLLLRVDL